MPETTGLQRIDIRPGHPAFLDLPWERELSAWPTDCPRVVQMERGLARHEVQFLSYGDEVYALKELEPEAAEREYEMLVRMEERSLPAVRAVGHARSRYRGGQEVGVLITRYLERSHPYRMLFQNPGLERYRERLLDSMAGLLVRLHLGGVYWGDCSLSNTLFRRDAGQLGAYLVDAETSEMHETLSAGQRQQDLLILEENVSGDLADLAAFAELPPGLSFEGTGESIVRRYEALWAEATREVMIGASEDWRIQERIRALNALGFSVGEVELVTTGDGDRLRMRTVVTDRDYHRHRFHDLTGLVAEERQAELMLNEIHEMQARLARELGRSVPFSVASYRWQSERWTPVIARLSPVLSAGEEPAQVYCQLLEHKWFLSEKARKDVGLDAAVEDYLKRFRDA